MVDKRRRKKARVQAESSSEDELSAVESQNDSPSELSELSEDETQPTALTMEPEEDQQREHPRERIHKAPQNSSAEFNQMFLKLVTEQFGEDLAAMRGANDFGPASITQLVAGLKQGVDIFSEEQRRML